jgi:nitronate monooxygenase
LAANCSSKIKTKIVPIVSSARAIQVIFQLFPEKLHHLSEAVVFEGPVAGGHIGFKKGKLNNPDFGSDIKYKIKGI